MSAMFFFLFLLNEKIGEMGKLREKRPRVKCLDRAGGAHLLQAMSMGSVKPGGVCAEASGCTCRPGGGGERDVDDGSCVLKMLENAGVVVVELNQACSAAGLFRDNSSRLQHANISVMSGPSCVRNLHESINSIPLYDSFAVNFGFTPNEYVKASVDTENFTMQ